MTYVVGYGQHNNDRSAIELACQFARSEPLPVLAVTVVPRGWGTPMAGGTDREFEEWAASEGEASAIEARHDLARHPSVEGSALWVSGRSVPQALIAQAESVDAAMLVVGSRGDAKMGRIRLSSKTDRLAHSSAVPVAFAPRGYRTQSAVTRVTVGFREDDAGWSLLTQVAEICRRTSARLRVVTFIVNPTRRPVTSRMSHTETQVIDQWRIQATAAQSEVKTHLETLGFTGDDLELCVTEGPTWTKAIGSLDWEKGDILVVGSSTTHPLARVFLGSSGSKILRSSPVPVVVVPGTTTK